MTSATTKSTDGLPDWSSQLVLAARPQRRHDWLRQMWDCRAVAFKLARADFEAKYKRALLGIVWAVGLPLIQAALLAIVFSRLIAISGNGTFAIYVLSGIAAWSYFSSVIVPGSTAIVDNSSLTDKVWFPRAILPTSPVISNLPGLFVTTIVVLVCLVPLGGTYGLHTVIFIPAVLLVIAFAWALSLVAAAMHVYFRDVRFIVQALMLLWFYVTPIAYPAKALGHLGKYLPFNPMTGVVALFHMAVLGYEPHWRTAVLVSIGTVLILWAAAVETYRRRDRLFVDLL